MTLIAHSIEPPFFTIGDLLMSRYEKAPFVPPAIPIDVNQVLTEEDRTLFPFEMRRKAYILKQNLVVAFSGFGNEIKDLLQELRIKCNYFDDGSGEISIENVKRILEDYDMENLFGNSSFFILHIDQKECLATKIAWGPWDAIDNEHYHETFANGSGADGYLGWLDQKVAVLSSHEHGDINRMIQINCAFVAKLLTIERFTRATIKDNWGAGFELILYTGSFFMRFDEIAYVLLKAVYDDKSEIDTPEVVNVMYYKYHGEVLVITSIELEGRVPEKGDDGQTMTYRRVSARVYPVLPIDMSRDEVDLDAFAENASFTTMRTARGHMLGKDRYVHAIPAAFNQGGELTVTYDQQTATLQIFMHGLLTQQMKQIAKELYVI